MIEGITNEILEKMKRDIEDELPWSEFIEFMDELSYVGNKNDLEDKR